MAVSCGRDVFVEAREDFVVRARQCNPYGDNAVLHRMNNIKYSFSIGAGVCSDDEGTSRGSMTSGEPARRALNCLSYLLNTHKLPEVFASGYGCQDDCGVEGRPGGTGGGSREELPTSSVCLKVSKGTPLEFTGFGAQYGPQLVSLQSLDSYVKRAKVSSSDKSWLFHDQELGSVHRCSGSQPEHRRHGPLVPLFFHVGFLQAVAIKDPKGLPVAIPFGNRQDARQREVLL